MAHGRPRISTDPPLRVTISDNEQAQLVDTLLAGYRLTLQDDRRTLFDRFTEADAVRQVVGVGSVGMRVYLLLLEGRSGADPLFLQVKQAGPAVYEAYTQPSDYDNHGARVITAALSQFARRYADQNDRDHAQLVSAIATAEVESRQG